MRSFHFRLERALEISRAREKHLEERLGQALASLQRESLLLVAAEERLEAEMNRRAEAQSGDIHLGDLALAEAYFSKAHKALNYQRQQAALAAAAVELRRADLLAASKDRQTLEKLRERRLSAFQLEVNREEQKQMDEVAARLRRFPA